MSEQSFDFQLIKVSKKSSLEVGSKIIRDEPLLSHLRKRKNMRVLDLGCRCPDFMWLMYHIYNCEKVVGIDRSSERGAMVETMDSMTPKNYEIYRHLRTLFDWYKFSIRPEAGEPLLIDALDEYNRIFEVHWETDIRDFLRRARKKFDYINASNILHFIEDQDELESIINHIRRLLNPDGLVFIRIQNAVGREYFDYPRFINVLKRNFMQGVLHENRVKETWEVSTFQNFDAANF